VTFQLSAYVSVLAEPALALGRAPLTKLFYKLFYSQVENFAKGFDEEKICDLSPSHFLNKGLQKQANKKNVV